jgi:hypothetical protein
MKPRTVVIALLILILTDAEGHDKDSLRRTNYGIELNQFITGSGYSSGTELLISVTEGRRNFNVGFYYCTNAKRITGVIARHEISLFKSYKNRILQPYAFYNGIARITKLENAKSGKDEVTTSGVYKTFEHHLGIGLRVILSKDLYVSCSTGYGIYFGSVKKPVIVNGTNEIAGSNGFSPIVKIGFGLIL